MGERALVMYGHIMVYTYNVRSILSKGLPTRLRCVSRAQSVKHSPHVLFSDFPIARTLLIAYHKEVDPCCL